MSHASSSKVCKYDIFLSFRGEDMRRTFVSHLYNALEQRGIHAFKDDERLEAGKSISAELLKAIEEARFAVVIFSKSYATSRWCLEELAHIINCKKELEQILIPVFYDVSPSDVRHQMCKKLEKLPENICDLQELDMLEDLGSLHSLEKLDVSGSNISCLPKSFKGLLHLRSLDVQFCQNLNELPGELPPNLTELFADFHLALKSIKDLVINCLKLYRLEISDCGAVSSEQVNVFVQHFLRACVQCDFHQRDSFLISIPGVRIPELFDYDRFINQLI